MMVHGHDPSWSWCKGWPYSAVATAAAAAALVHDPELVIYGTCRMGIMEGKIPSCLERFEQSLVRRGGIFVICSQPNIGGSLWMQAIFITLWSRIPSTTRSIRKTRFNALIRNTHPTPWVPLGIKNAGKSMIQGTQSVSHERRTVQLQRATSIQGNCVTVLKQHLGCSIL